MSIADTAIPITKDSLRAELRSLLVKFIILWIGGILGMAFTFQNVTNKTNERIEEHAAEVRALHTETLKRIDALGRPNIAVQSTSQP